MNLLNIVGGQWAMDPAKLIEIQNVYAAHLRGEKMDLSAVENRLGRALQNQPTTYSIQDGVAIIPIEGVIAKRMNMMTQISGGTSSQIAAQVIQDAVNDPNVHSIILAIDSPGGTVDGTINLADVVTAAGAKKPIVSLASGTMASAAYWIGSAAQAVYIADGTTAVGSIGVVASHTDISGAQAAKGIKTTEISAGKYKRIASEYGPLTDDGRKTIQDQLDYTYSIFVDAVAKNRGVSSSTVLARMADGKVFIGDQAIKAGLVDGVTTLDALVKKLNSNRATGTSPRKVLMVPMTRAEIDQAAKAYSKNNPGTDYLAAVKVICAEPRNTVATDVHSEGVPMAQFSLP